jgi:RecB family exonuclease
MPDVHRGVPRGEHRDVVVVELGDRARVVGLQLVVGDLVHPGSDRLPEELPARLPADGVGNRTDRVCGVDEAEGHDAATIDPAPDGIAAPRSLSIGGQIGCRNATYAGEMALSLIVGPPNSGRAGEIRARLEGRLEREPVLVVPTGDDAARFESDLGGGDGAVVGASIHTFRRLTGLIASATGAELRPELSATQRLALVRAAARETELRVLGGSAARRGFAPALERLIGELQAALVTPSELAGAAAELEEGRHEAELARLFAAYLECRDAAGRDDAHSSVRKVEASLRARPEGWGARPLFLYGFDDLTEEQLGLVAALAEATEITVAVNYEDREALSPRAALLARLRDELGGVEEVRLPFDDGYTKSATLRHLDRHLFEAGAVRVHPDDGISLLECGGERGEAEAIGGEIARLLADGVAPDDIAVVLRHPDRRGPLYARVFDGLGIPTAVEASVPLARTAAGRGLAALARASLPDARGEELLEFMRARPGDSQRIGDWIERRLLRGEALTTEELIAGWKASPWMLARVRQAEAGSEWLLAMAAAAHWIAEEPHAGREPVGDRFTRGGYGVPFDPLELRAATAAGAALNELAELDALPGWVAPSPTEALELLDQVRVPLWRGPTEGRVRVLSPYRARAARARHLLVASLQDGDFPGAGTGDPLLGDERRARLGIAALTRRDPTTEERYLFHACASRPTERLWLCWRNSDEEGRPAARSPFVDDVLDLLAPGATEAEESLKRVRGLDHVVFEPTEAPSERELERSLAARGPRLAEDLPGPLADRAVLHELAGRDPIGPGTLEKWIECPYRWFVDHELAPQRLDPPPDQLTSGSIVHDVLERLYRDPPGDDRIPRRGDAVLWRQRAADLLLEEAESRGLQPRAPQARILIARMRTQIERLLDRETGSETELRPALLEASFGEGEHNGRPPLDLGAVRIHGQIDRVDVTPDRRFGVVYDYKTGSRGWAAAKLDEEGKLQLQLYARALRDLWGIEPIGGLYYPLGSRVDPRPRGFVAGGVEATDVLDLARPDRLEQGDVQETLEAGASRATETAAAMRAGEIGRRPNGGTCPKFCRYQPICRLERSIGVDEIVGNGDAPSAEG